MRRTNNLELAKHWGLDLAIYLGKEIFVRCNSKGVIKWETTLLFTLDELLLRGNVKIVE